MTFIPVPRKAYYTEAKGYHPMSLLSFMQKNNAKISDKEYQGSVNGAGPLHLYQSAFKPGKSTETAMHHVITLIQEAVENRKLHLSFPRY